MEARPNVEWTAISGSWRLYNKEVEVDVRTAVQEVIESGGGIVTGGALGVDYIATEKVLDIVNDDRQLRIILPTSLEIYATHYRSRAKEGVISPDQAESLIAQLEAVCKLGKAALVTLAHQTVDQKSYYDRNGAVIAQANALLAFQVNQSAGTQDAIDKAREKGLPVRIKSYTI